MLVFRLSPFSVSVIQSEEDFDLIVSEFSESVSAEFSSCPCAVPQVVLLEPGYEAERWLWMWTMGSAVDVMEQSPGQPRRFACPHQPLCVGYSFPWKDSWPGSSLPQCSSSCWCLPRAGIAGQPAPATAPGQALWALLGLCFHLLDKHWLLLAPGFPWCLRDSAPFDCAHVTVEMEILFTHVWTARTFQRGTNALAKTALLRLTGSEPGAGLSTAHSVQPCVASCHAGSSACEAEAPLAYIPEEFRYE